MNAQRSRPLSFSFDDQLIRGGEGFGQPGGEFPFLLGCGDVGVKDDEPVVDRQSVCNAYEFVSSEGQVKFGKRLRARHVERTA